ncbi:dipeptidyl peptidase 9 [Plakobranchus ocellatus]|uniref:Dipeptidyl peptidase 9 n=1 Tax=Plakobranchus ocellatus TaxID=259542 RepID=A0AAV4AN76_9GAST|nr:dipeptidyl peptidase 9 [Plakobranchus ocellatus]
MASEDFDTYAVPTASPPRIQRGYKRSWIKLRSTVRETRKSITPLTSTVPSNFQFRSRIDESGKERNCLYFLGDMDKSRESTLLKVNIPDKPLPAALDANEENFDEEAMDYQESDLDKGNTDQQKQRQPREPVYPIMPVFSSHPTPSSGLAPMSKEEQLLRERKRLGTYGITSYEMSLQQGLVIIPAHNSLFKCYDNPGAACLPKDIPTKSDGSRLDPKICPSNPDLVAFINNSDIWLTCLESGNEIRLTHASEKHSSSSSSALLGNIEESALSAGVPSFVMQEEFDRYTGYWWSPQCRTTEDGKQVYHILYEEVDESSVEVITLFSPSSHESSEQYRYPRAGTTNASSSLRLLELTVSHSKLSGQTKQEINVQVSDRSMRVALFQACPWAEYLTRAGWTADGQYVYAVLLDRAQTRQAIMLISPSSFIGSDIRDVGVVPHMQCIYEETSDIWINVNDILHFFPQSSESQISFLFASEKSGFRHLYLVTSHLQGLNQGSVAGQHIGQGDGAGSYMPCQILIEVAVTSGPWVVMPKEFWVDEARGLVFFMGFMDSALESHLYVTSYDQIDTPIRLTELGFSHAVQLSKNFSLFVTVYSSLESPPQSAIFKLAHDSPGTVSCSYLGHLTRKPGNNWGLKQCWIVMTNLLGLSNNVHPT